MNKIKHNAIKSALVSLLLTGGVGVTQAAQDITAAEIEQINAQLAPVVNPQANAEKVGGVPEDPAVVVGTRFTYQGTLRLSGDRAQGTYDFRFRLYSQSTGNTQLGSTLLADDLPVTDGLFSTELDFGQAPIDGDDIWLQVEVRDGASVGAFTILTPRQRINATPYAVRALTGGGGGGTSPWSVSGSAVYYNNGNVGIGTNSPFRPLHISSAGTVSARFDGGPNHYVEFFEQGFFRGYLGSYQTAPGTTGADFEIGTNSSNANGSMHITTQATPRITVKPDGQVGVGTLSPLARLHVEAPAGENALRVRVDGTTRLWVHGDGHTQIYGDIQQNQQFGGALKAAVYISSCGGTAGNPQTISRQFNGVNSVAITATDDGTGRCNIDFPFTIDERFWAVSVPNVPGSNVRFASCRNVGTSRLSCFLWHLQAGNLVTGPVHVLVY